MTRRNPILGIIGITTLVLMIAGTIGNGINSAEAQRGPNQQNDPVNNRANQAQGVIQNGGLANINVGNVAANVGVPANVCVICG